LVITVRRAAPLLDGFRATLPFGLSKPRPAATSLNLGASLMIVLALEGMRCRPKQREASGSVRAANGRAPAAAPRALVKVCSVSQTLRVDLNYFQ
jgi:hypothetical protein